MPLSTNLVRKMLLRQNSLSFCYLLIIFMVCYRELGFSQNNAAHLTVVPYTMAHQVVALHTPVHLPRAQGRNQDIDIGAL